MRGCPSLITFAALTAGFGFTVVTPAPAADTSPWAQDIRSAARLIAGPPAAPGANLTAGVEVKLNPGWHTYWRYPGDSGVPPQFDFVGSDNVASVKVLYPAPHLFTDETGNTLGYKGSVIFPLEVMRTDKSRPATLRLNIAYAVCEKLCVPAEGKAELNLPGTAPNAALAEAEAQVPKPAAAADIGLTVKRLDATSKPLIAIDLDAPKSGNVEIFAEGPTPEWALPIPKPASGAPAGKSRFTFALDGLPPGTDPKGHFDLTFTVIESGKPIEVKTRLD